LFWRSRDEDLRGGGGAEESIFHVLRLCSRIGSSSYDFLLPNRSIFFLVVFFKSLLSVSEAGCRDLGLAYFILFRTDPPRAPYMHKEKRKHAACLLYTYTHMYNNNKRASEQGAQRGCGLGRIARFWTWTMKELHIISQTCDVTPHLLPGHGFVCSHPLPNKKTKRRSYKMYGSVSCFHCFIFTRAFAFAN